MSLFFFNDTATTEIYTLSLHDALPISKAARHQQTWELLLAKTFRARGACRPATEREAIFRSKRVAGPRSEEHTSELQSRRDLVCRLLLEKKKELPAGSR